jgi:hypothetical protein
MKNPAASHGVSSLERKFIILSPAQAGSWAIPQLQFFNPLTKGYNLNRRKQRGMDPAFQSISILKKSYDDMVIYMNK